MKDQELSNVFWSCGVLGVNKIEILNSFSQEILHPSILSALTPQAFSNILSSCARLEYKNSTFLEQLTEEIFKLYRLKAFEDQHIAIITWALGKLGISKSDGLKQLGKEIADFNRLKNYTPSNVCHIFAGQVMNSIRFGCQLFLDGRIMEMLLMKTLFISCFTQFFILTKD